MGRPRESLLDLDRIVDAALTLLDREGAAGLRTRRLATELGVAAPSLYHHVDGIGAILDAIRDRLSRDITVPDWDDLAWPEAVAAAARSYHASFARHPAVVPLLVAHPVTDVRTTAIYDAFIAKLVSAGWSPADAGSVLALVEAYVLGAVLAELEPTERPDLPQGRTHHEEFAFGLDVMIAGLIAQGPADAEPDP